MTEQTQSAIAGLRQTLIEAHRQAAGDDDALVIGLQLTHSGRFCKPHDNTKFEPWITYHHPILDRKFGYPPNRPIMSGDEVSRLIADYILAAKRARHCAYDFVDNKHRHGYLGHEFLSARTRPGRYGGSFENRKRFLREIVEGIRAEVPGLVLSVRLSAIDLVPFRPDPMTSAPGALGPGVPDDLSGLLPYVFGFGVDQNTPV